MDRQIADQNEIRALFVYFNTLIPSLAPSFLGRSFPKGPALVDVMICQTWTPSWAEPTCTSAEGERPLPGGRVHLRPSLPQLVCSTAQSTSLMLVS